MHATYTRMTAGGPWSLQKVDHAKAATYPEDSSRSVGLRSAAAPSACWSGANVRSANGQLTRWNSLVDP